MAQGERHGGPLHSNRIKIHRVPDVDPYCSNNPGDDPTAGACITGDYTVTPECKCVGDKWKADTSIEIRADIYVYAGKFPFKNRKPADPSVKDTQSGIDHEYGHLSDAVNAILPFFWDAEAKLYDSERECLDAIFNAAIKARPAWEAALKKSQHTRK